MAEKPVFTAAYEPDGRFWFVRVLELNRGTQAREFGAIERAACTLIERSLDLPAHAYRLRLTGGQTVRAG